MTTIKTCAYTPLPSQSLTRFNPSQLDHLNHEGEHDISDRVKKVVQNHFGYRGTEKFKATFTKQEITLSVKGGATQTLTNVSGRWMLSQAGKAATPLKPTLQKELDSHVDEILYRIRQTHNSEPSSSTPPISPRSSDSYERSEFRTRLSALESSLRAPSIDPGSRRSAARIEELKDELEEKELQTLRDSFDQYQERHSAQLYQAQTQVQGLWRDLEKLQTTHASKDEAAKREIADLERRLAAQAAQQTAEREAKAREIAEKEQAAAALQSELARAKEAQQGLEKQLGAAQLQADANAKAFADEQAKVIKAAQILGKLEQGYTRLEGEQNQLAAVLQSQLKKNQALEQQLRDAQRQGAADTARLRAQMDEKDQLLEEQAQTVAQLQKQFAALEQEKQRITSDLQAKLEANQALEEKLHKAETTNSSYAADTAGLRAQIDEKERLLKEQAQLQKQLAAEQQKLESNLAQLTKEGASQLARLEAQLEEGRSAAAQLQKSLEEQTHRAEELTTTGEKKDQTIRSLEQTQGQLRSDLQTKSLENMRVRGQAWGMSTQVKSSKEENERLAAALKQMQQKLDEQAAEIERLCAYLAQLKEQGKKQLDQQADRIMRNYDALAYEHPALAVPYGTELTLHDRRAEKTVVLTNLELKQQEKVIL